MPRELTIKEEREIKNGYLPTPEEIEEACYAIRMARPEPEPAPWRFPGWEYATPGSC